MYTQEWKIMTMAKTLNKVDCFIEDDIEGVHNDPAIQLGLSNTTLELLDWQLIAENTGALW